MCIDSQQCFSYQNKLEESGENLTGNLDIFSPTIKIFVNIRI